MDADEVGVHHLQGWFKDEPEHLARQRYLLLLDPDGDEVCRFVQTAKPDGSFDDEDELRLQMRAQTVLVAMNQLEL
jgi:hypothetical protein